MQLQLEQVQSGGRLGDRMLDLQAGVDLHERKQLLVWLVEELDCRRAAVTGPEGEPHRRLAEQALLVGGKGRAARLLDDLLVSPLDAAVADADRPGRALAVGDQLHLDVARRFDQLLEKDGVVPEGVARLRAGTAQRLLQLVRRVDARIPRPPPPAAALTSNG